MDKLFVPVERVEDLTHRMHDYFTQPKQKPKPITNADRIRAMSDEELADFITEDLCELLCGAPLVCEGRCKQKMLDWLREEA